MCVCVCVFACSALDCVHSLSLHWFPIIVNQELSLQILSDYNTFSNKKRGTVQLSALSPATAGPGDSVTHDVSRLETWWSCGRGCGYSAILP